MGTNGDSEPVSSKGELEKVLGQLGWSKRRLARVVYAELNDDDDPGEISRLEERIKKNFNDLPLTLIGFSATFGY